VEATSEVSTPNSIPLLINNGTTSPGIAILGRSLEVFEAALKHILLLVAIIGKESLRDPSDRHIRWRGGTIQCLHIFQRIHIIIRDAYGAFLISARLTYSTVTG
jgi:hypothetical protein